jgi:16S rRNA C967 or C1407 C5-methylase (RsmB/RsmF family)
MFDKILLDAPCSGSGTIRKSYKVLLNYSLNFVKRTSKLQKQLIETAFKLLKKGGTLTYSTCTLEPLEDEEVINYLLEREKEAELLEITLPMKKSTPFLEWEGKTYNPEISKCLRIYPQDNDTEGFFVAKITKK